MTVFVDASALIAIIAGEREADALSDALDRDPGRICSAISVWETVAGLCRSHDHTPALATAKVRSFLTTFAILFVEVGETEFGFAAEAYARFGKGRRPAALNMRDCLSYACAKANKAPLLFKGDDFAHTDITGASPS